MLANILLVGVIMMDLVQLYISEKERVGRVEQ